LIVTMSFIIAYADAPDDPNSAILIVLVSAGLLLLSAGLAFIPVCVAWSRRHRHSDVIVPLAVLWALIAAISFIATFVSQYHWSKNRMVLIESGYYDPLDVSGAPALPWVLWICLAVAYGALILWSLMRGPRPAPTDD
jgi:hypothetical protein